MRNAMVIRRDFSWERAAYEIELFLRCADVWGKPTVVIGDEMLGSKELGALLDLKHLTDNPNPRRLLEGAGSIIINGASGQDLITLLHHTHTPALLINQITMGIPCIGIGAGGEILGYSILEEDEIRPGLNILPLCIDASGRSTKELQLRVQTIQENILSLPPEVRAIFRETQEGADDPVLACSARGAIFCGHKNCYIIENREYEPLHPHDAAA